MFLARLGVRNTAQPHVSPPLGLLYLAAYVREKCNVEVVIRDQRLTGWTTDRLAREIVAFEPDIVGLGCVTAAGYLVPHVSQKVRSALPEALIVLGGPHASASRETALESTSADLLVPGEGELALEQILNAYQNDRDYSAIPGLIRRDSSGEIVTNQAEIPLVQELDSLPMPAYDLIELSEYWPLHSFVLVPRRKYISLMSSRGCPFQCNYCHQIFGKRFRTHSIERMIEEVRHYLRTYDVRDIELVDDVFNHDYDRALEFSEEIVNRGIRVKFAFPNGLRTDSLSEELIQAMVDAGWYYASFALEAGSPRVQKLMGKHLDIDSFVENVAVATRLGVFGNGFAMLGFPTETEAEMQQTVEVMCTSRMHTAQFFTVTPFPGTELYEETLRTRPELLEGVDFADSTFGLSRVNLSAEPDGVLFACQREANRRFYLNPNRLLRLIRDHPAPWYFPFYVPMFVEKVTKGLIGEK
jgi:radical SAM superfamily enzyme YgiQ (UPF0313 family)